MPASRTILGSISRSSWIRRMFEEGARLKRDRGEERVFDFTLGNPDLEPPPALLEALARVAQENPPGAHAYMPNAGYPDVRAEVARRLAASTGLGYTADHVVMTVGAAGALNVALKALVDPGDEVLLLVPFFAEYEFYVANHGARPVPVETREDCLPDAERIEAAITPRTRALIVNSPNNPSGVVYPPAVFQEIEARLAARGQPLTLLVDEPYRSLAFEGVTVPQVPPLVTRTVICDSWSKALAIPGERVGFVALSPRMEDADELFGASVFANRILGFVNAPAIWQRAILAAGEVRVNPSRYQERCQRAQAALTAMGYVAIPPQAGFYLFVKTPLADDLAFVEILKDEGILAVPGRGFGRSGYVRLSLTVPNETIERALPGFERALARSHKRAGEETLV